MQKARNPILRAHAAARRHQAPSVVGEGAVCLLERLLVAGQESELSRPPRSKELARNRETERKTEKIERRTDMGTQALMEQRCFNQQGVGIYSSYSQKR